MAKAAYVGVNGKARKIKAGYVGINGVAHKLKKAYVGDENGKARLCWSGEQGWVQCASPISAAWTSVCYGNSKFVAIAKNSNNLIYSVDAKTWTNILMPTTAAWTSICYGNGKFVAVASDGTIAYSTNATSWTYKKVYYNAIQGTIAYGDPSGVTAAIYKWKMVLCNNGNFTVWSTSSNFIWSTDAITWKIGWSRLADPNSVAYGNGTYAIAAGSSCEYAKAASDLTELSWTESEIRYAGSAQVICFGSSRFVVLERNESICSYSSDAIAWSRGGISVSKSWAAICYGNGKFVAVCDSGDVAVFSTNRGLTWSEILLPGEHSWTSICYGNGKFVAVASDGIIACWEQ